MSVVAVEARDEIAAVESFLYHEARLLDERRFEDWQGLFTSDGYYWVPTRWGETDPLAHVSLFYDDQDAMRTRIQRLRHPEIHVQTPPSRNVRAVSNVRIDPEMPSDAHLTVKSILLVLEYRQGRQRQFGGLVTHALLRQPRGVYKIRWKKVELINADDGFEALTVPF